MKIGAPKESASGENRVAMTPQSAKDLQKLGYECLIEKGAGAAAGFDDATYEEAGVKVMTAATLWKMPPWSSSRRRGTATSTVGRVAFIIQLISAGFSSAT